MNISQLQDGKYTLYQIDHLDKPGNENLISLLPVTPPSFKIEYHNSFIVNPKTKTFIGSKRFKMIDLTKILSSLNLFEKTPKKDVFQIVEFENKLYINPHFKQPKEIISREFILIGNIKSVHRDKLNKIRRLYSNYRIKPSLYTICIKGNWAVEGTNKQILAKMRDNTFINIEEYIQLLEESSLKHYL